MKYNKFIINNYKAIKGPLEINISNTNLVPLIGANECGKTTILQAIYSFDYANDKENDGKHLLDIRNLYSPGNNMACEIEAYISIKKNDFLNILSESLRQKYMDIDDFKELKITRNLDTKMYKIDFIENSAESNEISKEIISRLPYIIYNDDFIERPKNIINIPKNKSELCGWAAIYERAFEKANYSIYSVINEPNSNIKQGILSDVEDEINKTLVKEWSKISIEDGNCLSIKLDFNEQLKLQIRIVETIGNKNRYFNIEDRSKGFLWFFNFVMKIKYNPKSNGSSNDIIYLLDEPGSYLHTVAQERLCKMIKNISRKDGNVIYCTHTHHLLDPQYIPTKYIRIVSKNNKKEIEIKPICDVKMKTKKNSELQPVYEALGLSDWDFFTQKQKIIMVEGIYDKYALQIFGGKEIEDYIIYPGVNAESSYNNIPKFIAYNKKYCVIWDNDEEGRKYYEKACKNFGKIESKKFLLLPKEENVKKVRMEEMFENDDLKALATHVGLNENASYNNILLNIICGDDSFIAECKNIISEKTKFNFERLLKSIREIF